MVCWIQFCQKQITFLLLYRLKVDVIGDRYVVSRSPKQLAPILLFCLSLPVPQRLFTYTLMHLPFYFYVLRKDLLFMKPYPSHIHRISFSQEGVIIDCDSWAQFAREVISRPGFRMFVRSRNTLILVLHSIWLRLSFFSNRIFMILFLWESVFF